VRSDFFLTFLLVSLSNEVNSAMDAPPGFVKDPRSAADAPPPVPQARLTELLRARLLKHSYIYQL